MTDIYKLRERVYSEPTGVNLRPYIVEYLKHYASLALNSKIHDLTQGKAGGEIAGNICGALAWQGATGVAGDDWITEEGEPLLHEILSISSKLDIDTNNPEEWPKLLNLINEL